MSSNYAELRDEKVKEIEEILKSCLLYTSDAADD